MSEAFAEWGLAGVEVLHARVAVLVIVDVLSFCTVVDVAVSRGATVEPFGFTDERAARAIAEQSGAVLARPRSAAGGGYSLSPSSLLAIPPGTRLLLPSPNGSRISFSASRTPRRIPVLAGCLRNARAVAGAARVMADGEAIGVIPAGEHWPDGSLRFAVEDLLGAGAILDRLDMACSPEAEVMRDAWRSAERDLERKLRLSVSGRELIERGFPGDVDLAAELDVSSSVPVLVDGMFQSA